MSEYVDWRWFWNLNSDRDYPSGPEEGDIRNWCAYYILRNGHRIALRYCTHTCLEFGSD